MAALPLAAILLMAGLLGLTLITQNAPFIREQVSDPAGLETIALAAEAPPGAALLIPWGTRHFAVGFARDVELPQSGSLGPETDRLSSIRLVDHRADVAALAREGMLLTPDYTFYQLPPDWWVERLGGPVYLRAVASHLVQIDVAPETLDRPDSPQSFGPLETSVTCAADSVRLYVAWYTPEVPAEDLSVFVHALDETGALIGQGDQSAPVYGRRPLTTWTAGEVVRDVYPVPADPAAVALLRYGFYRVTDGGFENLYAYEEPVACGAENSDNPAG